MSQVRQTAKYTVIKELHDEKHYSINTLCRLIQVGHTSYYDWRNRDKGKRELENEALHKQIIRLEEEHNYTLGCRRLTMYVNKSGEVHYNIKRIRRVMRYDGIECVIRKKRPKYIRSTPQITAENVLSRKFIVERPNQKWLTDVTEFKYGNGQKAYLSAILDLGDRRIVAWKISRHNDNTLVFNTIDEAIEHNPEAKPLLHSDRGYQYTSPVFKTKLEAAGITQSMSRVGRCIDNGPMEGFWGILKSEMYHLKRFRDYDELVAAVSDYIEYYNTKRLQERLNCMSPIEYHNSIA